VNSLSLKTSNRVTTGSLRSDFTGPDNKSCISGQIYLTVVFSFLIGMDYSTRNL